MNGVALRAHCVGSDFRFPQPLPCPPVAWWEEVPVVDALPSALSMGRFYFSAYSRQFLAPCHLLALLGERKGLLVLVDLVKSPDNPASL